MINFYTDDGEGTMSGTADTIEVLQLKQGSKRKSQPESWEKNKKRKYVQLSKGKKMGEPCKWKSKCFEKVTEEERHEVFNHYWELGTNERKWDFHINRVTNSAKQRCHKNSKESRRSMTREYSTGGKRVCKVMYISILGMTDQCLITAFKKNAGRKSNTSTVDLRGGNHKKRVSERELVKEHIKLFPVKDSHYCQKDSNKKFLHECLTISKMCYLYKEWCANNPIMDISSRSCICTKKYF